MMDKFTKLYNLCLEVYLNEPFADKYNLDKIKNWSEQFLRAVWGGFYGDGDHWEIAYGKKLTSHDKNKIRQRYNTGVKLYHEMMPLAVTAITELYELEYKLHLLKTQYVEYINKFNLYQLKQSAIKLCDFLKEFIYTSMASRWCITSKLNDGISDVRDGVPANIKSIRDVLHKELWSGKSWDGNIWNTFQDKNKTNTGLTDDRGLYAHYSSVIGTLAKKIESNNVNDKIIGITMLLNAFHDDGRGLVIAQPNAEEEYTDILIPLATYEKASKINKNKVEKELKQEIFGY